VDACDNGGWQRLGYESWEQCRDATDHGSGGGGGIPR
jgi:hypothetical protein